MIKKLICFFLRFFCLKIRRQGFTLAEALIITVMTGACLLPILGTMQNAQVRTENYDHQSKMQQYARSRLTAEIANAAFDHKSINLEDEYHYVVYFDEDGDPDKARKIELVKTSLNKNYIESLNQKVVKDNWSEEACNLFGINKVNNGKSPYLNIIHAYKTSVETKDNPELAVFDAKDEQGEEIPVETPKALLGIVVKTCLLYSNGYDYDENNGNMLVETTTGSGTDTSTSVTTDDINSVIPVTLFSFVNLPTVSDEMIWLADAKNGLIQCIDPIAKTAYAITNLFHKDEDGYKPYHLAIHPSLKMLVYQTKEHLVLMNIDKKSSKYNNFYEIGFSKAKTEIGRGGLVFRPDGEYLFVMNKEGKKLSLYKTSYEIDNNNDCIRWDPEGKDSRAVPIQCTPSFLLNAISLSLGSEEITGLVPANDGYLYIARHDKDDILRVPMYPRVFDSNWKYEIFIKITKPLSIDISPDGTRLAVVTEEGKLYQYHTRDGSLIKEETAIKVTDDNQKYSEPYNVSYVANSAKSNSILGTDSLSIFITNKNQYNEDKNYILKSFDTKDQNNNKVVKASTDLNDKTSGGFAVVSPDNQRVIVNDQKIPYIYFVSSDVFPTGSVNSESLTEIEQSVLNLKVAKDDKTCTDIVTSKRDIMAVVSGEEAKKISFYDLKTFKKLEDDEFTATSTINTLAMNPQGDMLLSGHGDNNVGGMARYWLGNNNSSGISGKGIRKKIVFDDRTPNMSFTLEYPRAEADDAFFNLNNNKSDWDDVVKNDDGNVVSEGFYNRRDFDLVSDWQRLDMIGMPQGGALVLYGKNDGSSMIEWIGRRNWAQDPQKGKYRLFARWCANNQSIISQSIPATYDSSMFSTYNLNTIDSWLGRIFIVHTQIFPVNSIIKSCTGQASSNLPSGETRYITPVIVEYIDSTHKDIKVIDYANSIDFSTAGELKEDYELTWVNGGKILNENCRVGFYSGGPAGPDKGAIGYAAATNLGQLSGNNFEYLADYYSEKVTGIDYGDEENGAANYSEITDFTTIFKQYPNLDSTEFGKYRKYALIFKSANIDSEDSFPPIYSKKLAISPDCAQLAILAGKDNTDAKLRMYDFSNQLYGPETQIEGMLIDYRDGFTAGSFSETGAYQTPIYSWPAETDVNFFKKVQKNCVFDKRASTDTSAILLKNSTSKYDSWKSFNKYPANYFVDKNDTTDLKVLSNKRFFGYFRPESNLKYLQRAGSEDIRIFFNKSIKAGKTEVYHGNFILDRPISLGVNANESGILQLDETSNDGYGAGNIFLSDNKNAFNNMYLHWGPGDGISGKTNNVSLCSGGTDLTSGYCTTSLTGIQILNSSETYILKKEPILMWSHSAYVPNNKPIDNSDIIFSRDRANPIVFVVDRDNKVFWGIGSTTSGKSVNFSKSNLEITSNPVITSDGQKLLFALNNKLQVYDIASPTSSSFPNLLSGINSLNISNAKILCTKPYPNYSSSKTGGTYRSMNKTDSVLSEYSVLFNNSVTVASGGIYLYNHNKKGFICYNPSTNTIASYSEVLKKEAELAGICSYDNVIYVIGSDKDDIEDDSEPTDRIQSFNLVTNEALSSLDGSNLTSLAQSNYLASLNISGYDTIKSVSATTNSTVPYKKAKYAFDGSNGDVWISGLNDDTNQDITYQFERPFVFNCIYINNNVKINGRQCGVKNFALYHDSVTESNKLWEDEIRVNTQKSFDFTNTNAYSKYIFRCKDSHDNLNARVGVRELYFYRKGVSLLTPSSGWTKKESNYKHLEYNDPNIGKITVKSNEKDLHDLLSNYSNYYWGNFAHSVKQSYILFSFENEVKADIIRLRNLYSNKRYLKGFSIYGYKGTGSPEDDNLNSETVNTSNWECLGTFSDLKGCSEILTYEFDNNTAYNHYLFKMNSCHSSECDLSKLELWSSSSSAGKSAETPSSNYLTSLMTDNLDSVKIGACAACSTPYGIVVSGGHENGSSSNTSNKVLLYWPHAINKYDGQFYEYGISRSLPSLNTSRMHHSLVWHKGKLYAIGGKNSSSERTGRDFAEFLDYNSTQTWNDKHSKSDYGSMSWVYYTYFKNLIFNFEDGSIEDLKRYNHGACSFGDEIFIFGGSRGNTNLCDAYAWNPETGVVRKLNDIKDENGNSYDLSPCCAVPFGSKIYIMGMNLGNLKIFEYTP